MGKTEMETRKVKIRAHSYLKDLVDAFGNEKTLYRVAKRGDEIQLSAKEARRGDSLGAFWKEDEEEALQEALAASGEEGGSFDPAEAGEDELVAWIETENPTVSDMLEAAGGDPDVARRLLEAEQATGDPRKGAVEGLGAVITRAP